MDPDVTSSPESSAGDRLRRAKRRAKELLTVDGVKGIGIGDGTLRVYIRAEAVARDLPEEVDGVPLEPVVVDEAVAY